MKHILVAEDNEVNKKVLRIILEMAGVPYDLASDGEEAVKIFNPAKHSVILMDCQMPVMDGIEATRLIREREAREKLSRTPIIAVTANVMFDDRKKCLEAGMDDFLSKPFLPEELIEMIEDWTMDNAHA